MTGPSFVQGESADGRCELAMTALLCSQWSGSAMATWPITPASLRHTVGRFLLGRQGVETIRVVCAHDCPDMCSLLAHVENGRVVRVEGDPDQPFTAGFACAKVNRDAELVHSPERLATPLRRVGAKGEGKFAPITWDAALDEITVALEVHHRGIGPAGAARLLLQRASGADESRPAERAVPRDGHQPAVGRHGVRQLHARRRGTRRWARSAAPIRNRWSSPTW